MLIDSFAPKFDATEIHQISIKASREVVYDALWTADLSSPLIKFLMLLRSLPGLVARRRRPLPQNRAITLHTLIDSGFGALAEKPPEEIVLGITGRFWRPVGNLSPFVRSDFDQPVPEGFARGIWNFSLIPETENRTILRTETRVICGDADSRRKFLAYWLLVRPFSGLIRLIMLRNVRKLAEQEPASQSPVHVRRSKS
ncbi:MAG: hypothetical protein ACXW18_03165 [Pyrinomonadaceae bacterium]